MGAENASDPVLDTLSPLKHAEQAAIPVLLIHGKDDTFVPQEQSLEMAEALKKAGKPYELVELPGEDYWLSRADTRIQMLQTVVKFLEKNNPP
jgi:dipeptidyl aminopeptidase/acylaminoacyl peptidase